MNHDKAVMALLMDRADKIMPYDPKKDHENLLNFDREIAARGMFLMYSLVPRVGFGMTAELMCAGGLLPIPSAAGKPASSTNSTTSKQATDGAPSATVQRKRIGKAKIDVSQMFDIAMYVYHQKELRAGRMPDVRCLAVLFRPSLTVEEIDAFILEHHGIRPDWHEDVVRNIVFAKLPLSERIGCAKTGYNTWTNLQV